MKRIAITALLLASTLLTGCDALVDICMATGAASPEQCEGWRDVGPE